MLLGHHKITPAVSSSSRHLVVVAIDLTFLPVAVLANGYFQAAHIAAKEFTLCDKF